MTRNSLNITTSNEIFYPVIFQTSWLQIFMPQNSQILVQYAIFSVSWLSIQLNCDANIRIEKCWHVVFPKIFFFPIVVNFYLVVSFETFDEGLHVGNFVVETDRIWVHRIAIGKSGITVKKNEKKLEKRKGKLKSFSCTQRFPFFRSFIAKGGLISKRFWLWLKSQKNVENH